MAQTVEEKFKKLDDISHVLLRPGRYLGSVTPHTADTYVYADGKMIQKNLTWCPALLKTFDEVLSNSIDFSKTKDGKHLTTIRVNIDKQSGMLSVEDNGGIVVVKHKEHDQWVPEMIFELKAGSNFNDDTTDSDDLTGQNGEGAALTMIFSKTFSVSTADGKNQFKQTHSDNGRTKTIPVVKESSRNYTIIEWLPDYAKFNMPKGLDADNFEKLAKRVVDAAGCNPKLKFYLNGEQIKIKSFEDYVELYVPKEEFIYEENDKWQIAVSPATNGFEHMSFVNSTNTDIGGTHINFVSYRIVQKIREFILKKHKVDLKPADIKNQMFLFVNATIAKPRYSSQTKQDLITEEKDFKSDWEPSPKFIRKVLESKVVAQIMVWVEAKAHAEEMARLRAKNKELIKAKKPKKFVDANERKDREKCILLITEGDSAKAPIVDVRDPQYVGVFPLKGRVMNVSAQDLSTVQDNEETMNLCIVLGLQLGVKAKKEDLKFGKLLIATDADEFGNAIAAQLLNTFYRFWPELFTFGIINRLKTPMIKLKNKKEIKYFYSMKEFETWQAANPTELKKFEYTFLKGLGSSEQEDFDFYLNKDFANHCVPFDDLNKDDQDGLDLCFLKTPGSADRRKIWLDLL